MRHDEIKALFEAVKSGELSVDDAAKRLAVGPAADLGFARVDHHREARCGFPEVIFCQGKTPEQTAAIAATIVESGQDLLATRATPDHADAIRAAVPDSQYDELARTVTRRQGEKPAQGLVGVICAGTADLPIAREAAVTAAMLGAEVESFHDVGVAGLHRLIDVLPTLQSARAVVVCAGMEGALPSVVGGLVACPVIAVPTSVGYGASFKGVAALLAMLNSCAAGVSVVNIDNGFGAGYIAALINRDREDSKPHHS